MEELTYDDVILLKAIDITVKGSEIQLHELTKCTVIGETVDGYIIQTDEQGFEFEINFDIFEELFVRMGE